MDVKSANISKHPELEGLFQRVIIGEKNAFDEFYDVIRKPLFAYCLAIIRDEEEARDAFHTTVMKVYEARKTFHSGNVHAWIFTIARNTSRSVIRHTKFNVGLPDEFEVAEEDTAGLEIDEAEVVQRAIRKLPEEFRQVILLKYFGDMSVAEIAASENISMDLVKTRLFRARKRLAEILGTTFEFQS